MVKEIKQCFYLINYHRCRLTPKITGLLPATLISKSALPTTPVHFFVRLLVAMLDGFENPETSVRARNYKVEVPQGTQSSPRRLLW